MRFAHEIVSGIHGHALTSADVLGVGRRTVVQPIAGKYMPAEKLKAVSRGYLP